jgi:hypothetical protein
VDAKCWSRVVQLGPAMGCLLLEQNLNFVARTIVLSLKKDVYLAAGRCPNQITELQKTRIHFKINCNEKEQAPTV